MSAAFAVLFETIADIIHFILTIIKRGYFYVRVCVCAKKRESESESEKRREI